MGPTPLVSLQSLTKQWPRSPRPTLDAVSLDLWPGEIAWIGGANGVGKTTLLRVASGLIAPDSGDVTVCGRSPERERRHFQRLVGFLSAGNTGLYARLQVKRQLDYGARIALIPRGDVQRAIDSAIERFALEPLLDQRSDRLSLGQRQRVRLALCFLHDPKLILLDEPGNSLDEDGKQLLRSAVVAACALGSAMIWCAPTGEDLEFPRQREYALEAGRLVKA